VSMVSWFHRFRGVNGFSGVKTAQNNKTEGGTERNKKTKREAEGRRCAWGDLTSRKPRRMHRETAAEMASLTWPEPKQLERK